MRIPPTTTRILTKFKAKNPEARLLRRRGDLRRRPRSASRSARQGLGIPYLGADGIQERQRRDPRARSSTSPALRRRTTRTAPSPRSATSRRKAEFAKNFSEHFKADKEFNTPGAYSVPATPAPQIILKAMETLKANASADRSIREGVRARRVGSGAHLRRPSSARRRSTRTATPPRRSSRSTRPTWRPPRAGRLGLQEQQQLRRPVSRQTRSEWEPEDRMVPGSLHSRLRRARRLA